MAVCGREGVTDPCDLCPRDREVGYEVRRWPCVRGRSY